MSERFDDEVVWITGGGSGIGSALALELGRRGARVAVSGRRIDRLDEVRAALEREGAEALAVPCDVTDEASLRAALDAVRSRFGRLDVAVANAGFSVSGRVETLDAPAWRRQLETNVVGVGSTVHVAMPALRESRGRMVLVGSVASMFWAPGAGAYNASKAAVRAIGLTLAAEMRGTGVSVTTVHPGFVASEIGQVDDLGVHRPERADRRPRRLMWTSERAARVMADAIARRRAEVVFTGHGKIGAFFGSHFPGLVARALGLSSRGR